MATEVSRRAFVAHAILASVILLILSPAAIATAQVRRILEDRGPIQKLDLYWGNTSPRRAPVSPYTFISEVLHGTNPKAILRDAKGVTWNAKWDEEVRPEVAATRLAWALGLRVEETYYVADGQITFPRGKPSFHRLGPFIDKTGRFRYPARFERRGPDLVNKGSWTFGRSSFANDGGQSILVLMDVVMANWDTKDSNHKILSVADQNGTTDWYIVGDYGACFGKWHGASSHSKFRLHDYLQNRPVITSIHGSTAHLGFSGSHPSAHASVPLSGVRLFAQRASGLTVKQVEDAFRAAHASDAEVHGFAQATYERIQEVVRAADSGLSRAEH